MGSRCGEINGVHLGLQRCALHRRGNRGSSGADLAPIRIASHRRWLDRRHGGDCCPIRDRCARTPVGQRQQPGTGCNPCSVPGAFRSVDDHRRLERGPADGRWQLLWASRPRPNRALTLYQKVHPQRELKSRPVHNRFLNRLAEPAPRATRCCVMFASTDHHCSRNRPAAARTWRGGTRSRCLATP